MFDEIFTKFYEKNREIKVVGVWGRDGLVLEKRHFSQAEGVDLDFTGAELADVIAKVNNIKLTPQKYFLKLNINETLLIVYSLTPDFFLVVLADKGIIIGKLTFYFDLYKNKLIAAL